MLHSRAVCQESITYPFFHEIVKVDFELGCLLLTFCDELAEVFVTHFNKLLDVHRVGISVDYPRIIGHKKGGVKPPVTVLQLAWSCLFRWLRACLRARMRPLQVPLPLSSFLECFCQLGTFMVLLFIQIV